MSRSVAAGLERNFKRGLVTEATGLNFPEDACTDVDNCVFDEKGRVTRRTGIDFEQNASFANVARNQDAVAGFLWNNAAGDGSASFRVQQIGTNLYFYRVIAGVPLSGQLMDDVIDLTAHASGANESGIPVNECQFTATSGQLIVVHPYLQPFYVEFNPAEETLTDIVIPIRIRDHVGLPQAETSEINQRPAKTLSTIGDEYLYNLYNQGWYFNSAAALGAWDTARSDLPSNADIWWAYKGSDGTFDLNQLAHVDLGNTPAPKGHFLLNLFSQNRSTASGIAGLPVITTGLQRFSTVTFFSERLFYSGLNAIGHTDKIYFTQVIEETDDFGKCHQSNDPTSETAFDLLPSDGGHIAVKGIDRIVKMVPLQNVLLIFSTNGIWTLTGSEGLGFRANDYTLTKLSSIGCVSHSSFIDVNGFPVWWNEEGIFSLTAAEDGFSIGSLTDESIRTFFQAIPVSAKRLARGDYNPMEKVVRWIYRSQLSVDVKNDYEFDRVLSHNLLTGAFYPWSLPESDNKIHDLFSLAAAGGAQSLETVVDNAGEVVEDEDENEVTVYSLSLAMVNPDFRYFVSKPGDPDGDFAFARHQENVYKDWVSNGPATYDSHLLTGFYVHGQGQRFFQTNYVFVFTEVEQNASLWMQGIWDWTTDPLSGKWSTPQQAYNSRHPHRQVPVRRLKVRGKGRACQLRFVSEEDKPFTVIGWSLFSTQNNSI